jgi:hypothetical protein
MGRRTNYGFEKRQREIKKQKKNEKKAEKKRQDALARAALRDEETHGEAESDGD